MSDLPSASATPLSVSTYSLESAGAAARNAVTLGAASRTWVANLAIYVPVYLPVAYPVQRVWWVNGSTVTSTNVDFGIYTADGVKLYSTGSTAMSGVSLPQFVTPTAFTLPAGAYYFAWACSNTTSRGFGGNPTAASMRLSGVLEEASALPLPAVMTPAAVSNALYPFCGITRDSVWT